MNEFHATHPTAKDIEFLQSCVKSADAGRDKAERDLAELKAAIIEHAGQSVLDAWTIEIVRNRHVVAK